MVAVSGMTPAYLALGVSDLNESERFYRDVLGWTVARNGDTLTASFGSFAVRLDAAPPTERAKISIGFRVDDAAALDAIVARANEHGGRILAGPAPREDGGQAILLMDPDHYQIEIIAR